ncbi:hypothetical protein FJT64_012762 [Amphibalanus amphitrite]|uniref:SGNH hydrolase-type esterase domain-containing protein n=1 Tax=Amphibalanus amphitrite TaxID=1232801 RepID=A0A6A4V6S2_AMPAM|nr:hypothetical protein FJT64_012762 [Amphibalanus amphitrite]
MQLIIGDSFAFWAARRCTLGEAVRAEGWRGACISSDGFRRWAVATVRRLEPAQVVLLVGSNDLAAPQLSIRLLVGYYEELTMGMLAAGAGRVIVMPLPPRTRLRARDVSVAVYRRRRRLANQVLRRQFSRTSANPEVTFGPFVFSVDFLGPDGVHPSAAGWQALAEALTSMARNV